MNTLKQAQQVLSEAERQIRELVASAASVGDYELVLRMTNLARSLGDLAGSTPDGGSASGMSRTNTDILRQKATAKHPRLRKSETARPRRRSRVKKGEYPKFLRSGDQLVKIGWSRKEREEYTHKAPKRVAETLAEAIARHARNGDLFTAEELFPLKDQEDGGDVPGYQGYVALAWLRTVGLVEQHGRSGYTAPNAAGLGEAMRAEWDNLSEQTV